MEILTFSIKVARTSIIKDIFKPVSRGDPTVVRIGQTNTSHDNHDLALVIVF